MKQNCPYAFFGAPTIICLSLLHQSISNASRSFWFTLYSGNMVNSNSSYPFPHMFNHGSPAHSHTSHATR